MGWGLNNDYESVREANGRLYEPFKINSPPITDEEWLRWRRIIKEACKKGKNDEQNKS